MPKHQVSCCDCGTAFKVHLEGPRRTREWRLKNWDWRCDACRQKAIERANAEAASQAESMGLPELTGTEKQIPWAENIRMERVENLREYAARCQERPRLLRLDHFEAEPAVTWILGQTSAAWWINHRELGLRELLQQAHHAVQASDPVSQALKADADADATVRPPDPITETVAEITAAEDSVTIRFPEKRDDFRELVRFRLRYTWTGSAWVRKLSKFNGTPADRAGEAGAKLLNAGFIIRIHDPETREKAVGATYIPECRRWIKARVSGKYAGWFSISWTRPDDFYSDAKRLPAARYDKPDVVVPAEHYNEVADFARINGFRISDGARALMGQAADAVDRALVASPEPADDEPPARRPDDGKPAPMDVPENVDVPEDFMDETLEGRE